MFRVFLSSAIKFAVVLACVFGISSAQAFDLGVPKMGGDKDKVSAPSQSLDDAINSQEAIVKRFAAAEYSVTEAQSLFSQALGLQVQLAKAQENKAAYDSGAVMSKDSLKKAKARSREVDDAIAKATEDEKELSPESKIKFAQGLAYYAKGVGDTKKLLEEFSPFLNSAKAQFDAASPMQKMSVKKKLDIGVDIATKVPGHLKDQIMTISKLVSFAKKKNIKVPKEATDLI